MNTAAEALLIIVSAVLAIFLLAGIVALVKFIQLLKFLKHFAEKAERIADSAETVAETLRKSAGRLTFFKLLANIVEAATKHNKEY